MEILGMKPLAQQLLTKKNKQKKGHFIFLPDCPEYTNEH